MSLFTIDLEKCNNDSRCALECPAVIIEMTEKGPVPAEDAEEVCIQCGHCVSVCPTGAFALKTLSPEDCIPIREEQDLDSEQIEYFLRSRRSIRRYKKKPVPRQIIEKALGVASHAPTGSNKQPVEWIVVDQKQHVEKIGSHVIDWMRYVVKKYPDVAETLSMEWLITEWEQGIDRICRDAPQMVFTHASNEIGTGAADCHTALAYLELALPGFGLGSCWAGYVNYAVGQWPPLAKELNLPDNHTCHGAVMVGYPKFKYHRVPKRNTPVIKYYGE